MEIRKPSLDRESSLERSRVDSFDSIFNMRTNGDWVFDREVVRKLFIKEAFDYLEFAWLFV
jgi:hypothetical protein